MGLPLMQPSELTRMHCTMPLILQIIKSQHHGRISHSEQEIVWKKKEGGGRGGVFDVIELCCISQCAPLYAPIGHLDPLN